LRGEEAVELQHVETIEENMAAGSYTDRRSRSA
jgi:hypothetical protein